MAGDEHVGVLLADLRSHQDIALPEVATALRIRLAYLEAIEEGRTEDLPGPTYAVGFVRAYADYLGLESAEVVRRFKAQSDGLNRKTDLVFPVPMPEGRFPGRLVIAASVVLAVLVYGGWYAISTDEREAADLGPPAIERTLIGDQTAAAQDAQAAVRAAAPELAVAAATTDDTAPAGYDSAGTPAPIGGAAPTVAVGLPASAPSAEAVDEPAVPLESEPETAGALGAGAAALDATAETASNGQAEPATVVITASAETTAPATEPSRDDPDVTPSAVPAEAHAAASSEATVATDIALALPEPGTGATPPPPAAPRQLAAVPTSRAKVYGAVGAATRIVVRARLDSWVQVRDGQSNLLLTRILRSGDSYQVPDEAGLTLLTGNAGALEIVVDGTLAPSIGPLGAVRRNVLLDPDRLLAGDRGPRLTWRGLAGPRAAYVL